MFDPFGPPIDGPAAPPCMKNIPEELYISSPNQLTVGQELWHVGQGGVTLVKKPNMIGTFVRDNGDGFMVIEQKSTFSNRTIQTTRSMRDCHILPQEYNNWYIAHDERTAWKIYFLMVKTWGEDGDYEKGRDNFESRMNRFPI